jgi:hypothetical protein
MAWEIRYRIDSVEAKPDGSRCVQHDTWAEAREEGEEDWQNAGLHQSFLVPADEVQEALAAGTNPQIVTAYKDALVANRDTPANSNTGWSKASIQARMEANAAASAAAAAVNAFVADDLGQEFPVVFQL